MEKTPFDCWWQLFGKHCPRMSRKPQCKKKFEAFSLEEQRVIYRDTQERLKWFEDWQPKANGVRSMMKGPHPYLNGQDWLDPVQKPSERAKSYIRDTTKEIVNPEQDRAGLENLRAMLAERGLDHSHIDRQLER